jgi:hypothetical protein
LVFFLQATTTSATTADEIFAVGLHEIRIQAPVAASRYRVLHIEALHNTRRIAMHLRDGSVATRTINSVEGTRK